MILLSKLELEWVKHMNQAYHFEINKSIGQHPYKHTLLLLLTDCALLIIYVLLHYFIKFGGQSIQKILHTWTWGFRNTDSKYQLLQTNQPNSLGKNSICICVWEYSTWRLTCERTFWISYLMFDQIRWFVVSLLKVWFLGYPESSPEVLMKNFNYFVRADIYTAADMSIYIHLCSNLQATTTHSATTIGGICPRQTKNLNWIP